MAQAVRWTLALATLAVALGSASPAHAQNGLICTASAAVTPILRHEGSTEMTGDIFLECTGTPGATPTPTGTAIPQADISVSLNVPVTSRILGGAVPELLTDALLVVDDPSPANQDPCLLPTNPAIACQVFGDGGQTFNKPGKFNVFEGLGGGNAPSPDSVTFLGVPVDPPLTVRTYRITNIRVDATSLVLGSGLSPVLAFVSASPATSIEINNPQNYTGFAANGLTANTSAANPPFLQCQTYPITKVGAVSFTEDFATAFKVRTDSVQNTPGVVYYSESGLEISLGGLQAGYADTGTRLQTLISNIPAGVTIYVDNWAQSAASIGCTNPGVNNIGCLLISDASLVTEPATPRDPGTNTITQVTNGAESSVLVQWEVTNTNPFAIDLLTFNIYASIAGMPAANQTASALSGFSPQLAAYSSTGPIPEFSSTVNVATSPTNLFTISACPVISGQVTLSGAGLSGVAVTLTGSENGAATTDSSGNYTFPVPPGGSYTVTPSLTGYTFTPPNQTFDNLSGGQTANFVAVIAAPRLMTLYTFPGGNGGAYPYGGVAIGKGGVLFGTTAVDGASNHGTVFSLTPPKSAGGAWSPAVLNSFTGGSAGSDPQAGVAIGAGGVLYGAAGGTVFSLTPPAVPGGAWTETVVYRASGVNGLAIGNGGVLYGTTSIGGSSNLGMLFSLTPPTSAGGAWAETVLHSFTGGSDGSHPLAPLIISKSGVLYGTTEAGGSAGHGTVFSLTPPAVPGGAWTEMVLCSFTGGDGANPKGKLAIGSRGELYGTTYAGGASNLGTVFILIPPATAGGAWTRRILHSFTSAAGDGANPFAGLVAGTGGVLYGTTAGGGSSTSCNSGGVSGCGTIFSLTPPASAGDAWTEAVLYSFTGAGDGNDPQAGLVIGANGLLYGAAAGGGAFNNGTIFALVP